MLHAIRVGSREADPRGKELLEDIKRLGLRGFKKVRTVKVYRIEGLTPFQTGMLLQSRLKNVNQRSAADRPLISDSRRQVEVAYKPGVMNPESASLMKMARDIGLSGIKAADSSIEYHFDGTFSDEDVQTVLDRLLVNPAVQIIVEREPTTLLITAEPGKTKTVPLLQATDEELMSLSKDKLFLNLEEMRVIQAHFKSIERNPTDAELETLAQTWSEHCGHKTFRARLIVNGVEKAPLITRLKQTSARYSTNVVSSFVDNSGVMRFYDGFAICGKVETHNSPSAIEPYGGAATGSGGVFRDIMGTGEGAKVIASTDMFCVGPPDLPDGELPKGCIHPGHLLTHVAAGVRDYGNRMGIPTVNGSVHFHPDFRAKPSIIVGAYGILREERAKKGEPQPGDIIVALGGRTGRDGIHGATFSSAEMTDRTSSVNAAAVQIGNPIEEKRMIDAMLALRDCGYIRAVTDCGAGGFASAIGEMGSATGVRVELNKAPLKYPGLAPWEIWLSESQERMVLAVPPEYVDAVLAACRGHNVEATVLGEFTDDQRLFVAYNDETICDLSMEFLHDGLPQRTMEARYMATEFPEPNALPSLAEWNERYRAVMRHPNVASKEPIVRMYDHTVQGTSALTPFVGVKQDGPADAAVLRPLLDRPYGLVLSHGLNPVLNRIDPYWGSVSAGIEALANLVAVGGSIRPGEVGLIDNFIWPFPDAEALGSLDLSVDACVDLMNAFELPFVSGKDSLSGTYRGGNAVIKIPPVLCVSAFSRVKDAGKTISSDFKTANSHLILVGRLEADRLGGSVFYDTLGYVGNRIPKPDLAQTRRAMEELEAFIATGVVLAAHDVSEGGLGAALAEMCFGGHLGADIDLSRLVGIHDRGARDTRTQYGLFYNEMPGCFLIEADKKSFRSSLLNDIPYAIIGSTLREPDIRVRWGASTIGCIGVDELKSEWQKPMQEVFHA